MARVYLSRMQNDYGDVISFNLENPDETISDITGATAATLQTRHEGYSGLMLTAAMTIMNAALGIVQYTVQAADFPVAGLYYCQVVVTYPAKEITYDPAVIMVKAEIA